MTVVEVCNISHKTK